jgi:hypothetical protein
VRSDDPAKVRGAGYIWGTALKNVFAGAALDSDGKTRLNVSALEKSFKGNVAPIDWRARQLHRNCGLSICQPRSPPRWISTLSINQNWSRSSKAFTQMIRPPAIQRKTRRARQRAELTEQGPHQDSVFAASGSVGPIQRDLSLTKVPF